MFLMRQKNLNDWYHAEYLGSGRLGSLARSSSHDAGMTPATRDDTDHTVSIFRPHSAVK